MKNRIHLVLALICVIPLSCGRLAQSELAQDATIRRIFNETEIRDLNTVLSFFESQICDLLQVRSDRILDCYDTFFKNMSSAQGTGIIYIPVSFPDQLRMYSQLSDGAFSAIWIKGKAVDQVSGATSERLMLTYEGKYMQFLEALRNEYTFLEAYRKSFAEERKMTPVMIESVLYNYHLYPMTDIRMRLFVALHYLTLNDVYERKKE